MDSELYPGLGAGRGLRLRLQTKKPLHDDGTGDGGLRGGPLVVKRGTKGAKGSREPLDLPWCVSDGLEQKGKTPACI